MKTTEPTTPPGGFLPAVACSPVGDGQPAVSSLVEFGCDQESARSLVAYVGSNAAHYTMQYQAVRGWMHTRMTHEDITDWLHRFGYGPPGV